MTFPNVDDPSPNGVLQDGLVALNLGCPLDAEHAPQIAGLVIGAADRLDGTRLDFSPETIADCDRIISMLRDQGVSSDDVAESLIAMGCYVGEVLVREHGGAWRDGGTRELALAGVRLVVDMPGRGWCNPIMTAVHRHRFGDDASLVGFYETAIAAEAS